MSENELATIAVDIAYKIHNELGPGLLENVYEAAFCHELEKRKINFTCQQAIPVYYDSVKLDLGFRADIIIEKKLLIEIKSVASIEKVFHKITLTYLKHANLKLGLLINFNVNLIKEGIHRKILGQLFE
jgi:GxxExxY protein